MLAVQPVTVPLTKVAAGIVSWKAASIARLLFGNGEQGAYFRAYNPDDILKRRNLATNTGFQRGSVGVLPTDWIERGLVTGRKVVDASTASGFAMRVTSNGGVMAATDDVRLTVNGLSPGTKYTVRFKAKLAPGYTTPTLRTAFGATTTSAIPLTAEYQQIAFTHTATGATHSLFFGGDGGATSVYDVADVEVLREQDAGQPYQPVTDWITEYIAAGGNRIGMWQDNLGTTPVTAVEQPCGLLVDMKQGGARGPERWSDANAAFSGGSSRVAPGVYRVMTPDGTYSEVTGPGACVIGEWYEITFNIDSVAVAGAGLRVGGATGGATVPATVGPKHAIVRSDSANAIIKREAGNLPLDVQISNVSFKALPGNHATEATTANRPVLSARYNLHAKTQEFDDASWVKVDTTITANAIAAPDGSITADLLTEGTAGTASVYQNFTVPSGVSVRLVRHVKAGNTQWVRLRLENGTDAVNAWFDLQNGIKGSLTTFGAGVAISHDITPVGSGWYRIELTGSIAATTTYRSMTLSATADAAVRNNNATRYEWGADARFADDAALNIPPYQRVNTATDYATVGFPHYLKGNGVNTRMATGNVDFTGTNKVTVVAAVTKSSDAVVAALFETSPNSGGNVGAFAVFGPHATDSPTYSFRSTGSVFSTAHLAANSSINNPKPAPSTNILTCQGSINEDRMLLSIDGAPAGSGVVDQGDGNYGNYVINLFSRNGTGLFFNGRLYSLAIVGAAKSIGDISRTERKFAQEAKKVLA